MLIKRLIKEVEFELKEAHRLLDELTDQEIQFGINNDNLLAETTKDIITDQKKLLTNLKIDKLATVISKIEDEHVICPSCRNGLPENKRVIRLPYYSLINIKENPIPPVEIIIIDICQHCNYILDFEFFKGDEAHQLYQLLIEDLSDTEFELKEGLKNETF